MQNRHAQQRQISRCCSFRCDLSENHRPLAKTQGMHLQTHTADPLLGVPISVPIFVPIFCSDFFCCFSAEKLQKKIRNKNQNKNQNKNFSIANMDPNRQGGLHMTAGSGVGQIFTSMTIYTSHSLEAYPYHYASS